MRFNVAIVDQVVYTWRHHGRRAALRVARSRLRRTAVRMLLLYQYPNVEWGRNVVIQGKLVIRGTGTVVIGNGVRLDGNAQPVRLIVSRPDARIEIGDRSALAGAVIIAAGSIRIGRGCLVARSRIADNDWHATSGERRGAGPVVDPRSVTIEDNVWLGDGSMVLRGVTVGANSVVGAGTVIRANVPRDTVVIGNPQRAVRALEPAARLDTSRVIKLIEAATQSVPGRIDASTRIDDPDLWDSLSVVQFMSLVQDETGLELTLEDVAGCATPQQLAEAIARLTAT